jgi:hypothetical protein
MNGCDAECSGSATKVRGEMGGGVYDQCVCGGLGVRCWLWIRWVGERDKFCTPD